MFFINTQMVKIYCIEDINDLKYVGATTQQLERRFQKHQSNKRNKEGNCSSNKLHLEYSTIYELEECEKNERHEREKYWINKIDCVNTEKLNGVDLENKRQITKLWQKNNREKCREHHRKAMNKYNDIRSNLKK